MKHITKYRTFQVCVVVENVENLDVGCCFYLCVCLCVCVCVCVASLAAMRVRFTVWSGGFIASLYDTHEAESNDTLS